MRIVIDMQGAQTESRFRGIGRYTLSFAQAVVRNRGEHEIILALSNLFPETIEPIRAAFDGLLPQENIRVWHALGPVKEENPINEARRKVAELLREAFLTSLKPDVIHICSLFEGYVDDAVTSIRSFDRYTLISTTLHDFIPLLNPEKYLQPNPLYKKYYEQKINYLKKSDTYLAVSESSSQEGITILNKEKSLFINTLEACDSKFQPQEFNTLVINKILTNYNIKSPFILYTGGADERKNLPRLIQAYAALPKEIRKVHQLVFAGKMPDGNILNLKYIAKSAGLSLAELVFTGYVNDEELVQLYNLCKLFVFPSWHEGFGLPALEAMACGAPTIAANTSSLPEVIGLDEALFDPFSIEAITSKLKSTLQDDKLLQRLRTHGLQQSQKFSWDSTAKRAITAWEALPKSTERTANYLDRSLAKTKLLTALSKYIDTTDSYLINLANVIAHNESTSIERQLLLDVSELCQQDAATGVQRVVRSYLKWLLESPPKDFRVEPVYATQGQGYRYARQFTLNFLGQSSSQSTDEPVRWQQGDIFFGLDMQHHVQLSHQSFYRQLQDDGVVVKFLVYDLLPIQLAQMFSDLDAKSLHEQWLAMVSRTNGAICISKATADAFGSWLKESNIDQSKKFQVAWVHNGGDIAGSKPSQGLPIDAINIIEILHQRPSFLCVSTLEPRKCQQQIFEAVDILWQEGLDINLVFVGQQGWKTEQLAERLQTHCELNKRLFWLKGISDEFLEQVYAASACLIAASLNEGFGLSLIEAARHNIPIIARDIPVFREVAGDYAYYFQGEQASDLAKVLKCWLDTYKVNKHPTSINMPWLTWQQSTEKLKTALIEQNYSCHQLLVDISELVQRDAKSGIQRVVRSILKEWLLNPPHGYRVEPVYATTELGYRYARQFTQSFLELNRAPVIDTPIEYSPKDIFLALDFQPLVQIAQRSFYQTLRRQGVEVKFIVYDLLCVTLPQYFPVSNDQVFNNWLNVVAENNGAICISEAVANELSVNTKTHQQKHNTFNIQWFHLGADVANSHPTQGFPVGAEITINQLHSRPSFLMVGTLEPRKGYTQVLDAFEYLWRLNTDVNLAIVGKQGWMIDEFISRLHSHSELNKRLFWFEGISDEYLEKIYANSTCLIAASYGEGFGLPLIEAAQHKLPIIARDIPVFREVAGNHAYYFGTKEADSLAQYIKDWLLLAQQNRVPKSDDMPFLTWKKSAAQLGQIITSKGIF